MNREETLTEVEIFAKLVSVLKKHGLREAPDFNEASRIIAEGNDRTLERLVSNYPDRDQFESLLFLYWDI